MNTTSQTANHEREVTVFNGWAMLPLLILLLIANASLLIYSVPIRAAHAEPPIWGLFVAMVFLLPVSVILLTGFFTLQPNEARVLILFGAYRGTVRQSGFHWGNPFYSNGLRPSLQERLQAAAQQGSRGAGKERIAASQTKANGRNKVSLRARTLNMEPLKVNDKRGNPIEIAAVVVWRVQDTAQAAFDVDDYENYVHIQSESALRHLASAYAYDHGEENEVDPAQRGGRGLAGPAQGIARAARQGRRAGG